MPTDAGWTGKSPAPMDGTVVGATQILLGDILPSEGKRFAPIRLLVETITANSITETAIISLGFNSPNYNDMVGAYEVNPVEGVVEIATLPPRKIVKSGSLRVRIIRAASGTALTFGVCLELMASTP